MSRYLRNNGADCRVAHQPRNVFPVEPDIIQATIPYRCWLDRDSCVPRDPSKCAVVVGGDSRPKRRKRNRSIQRARVKEHRTQSIGE